MKANVNKNPRRNRPEQIEISIPGTSVHIPQTYEEAQELISDLALHLAVENGFLPERGDDSLDREQHHCYLTLSPLVGPKVRFAVDGSRERSLSPAAAKQFALDLMTMATLAERSEEEGA